MQWIDPAGRIVDHKDGRFAWFSCVCVVTLTLNCECPFTKGLASLLFKFCQPTRSSALPDGGGLVDSIQEGAETVKEKLNLNQPLPESTKLFFKQIKGEDVEFKDPVPSDKGREPQNE